jgi:hypothetical protein
VHEESAPVFSGARVRAFLDVAFDGSYDWNVETDELQMSGQIDALLGLEPGCSPRSFAGWTERLPPRTASRPSARPGRLRAGSACVSASTAYAARMAAT